jgi:hypothetical protein
MLLSQLENIEVITPNFNLADVCDEDERKLKPPNPILNPNWELIPCENDNAVQHVLTFLVNRSTK